MRCERVLERPHVAREVRLGQLEEPRAVRIQRLGRECLDRRLEPLVERTALDGELRLCSRERALELDDLLRCAGGARGARAGRRGGRRARRRETDEESER